MNKCVLPAGGTITVKAKTIPEERTVVWSIEHRDKGVKVKPINASTGSITAKEDTGSGWIKVRATDKQLPTIYTEAAIHVGCDNCSECDKPGRGVFTHAGMNIDARFSLGKTAGGLPAGDIFLRSDEMSSELATPGALSFSTLVDGVEPVYDDDLALRQIITPQCLVDIQVANNTVYDINFYSLVNVQEKIDEFYTLAPGAVPFSNFEIEMPPPSANGTSQLLISETRGGATTPHVYSHNPQENSWSLIKGNGLQDKTRVTQTGTLSGDRIVTETVKDDSGQVAYIVQTTYHNLPWGEDVIEIVEDPDGAALTTTMSYFENPSVVGSYERIESRINPDGSWVRYEYDNEGRTLLKVRSWLDAPIGASALSAHATYYDYTPVDPDDNGLAEFQYLPRTVTERIEGNITARTYYAYWKGPSGERVEIIERCVKPTESYGDVSSQRTITTYYPSGDNILDSGRIKSAVYPDGLMDTYTYEYGSYESGHISIGAGRDICETVVHGTVNNPEGIAYKTTKETSIQDEFGNTVLQEMYVYMGEGYQRIQWTEQTYDDDGHVTKVSRSDGTQTDSTWGCCNKESDTDARGIERHYSYDELNRLESSTKQGTNTDITTSYTYDAIGRRLTETVSAGELSQVTRNIYDLSGRRQSMTDPAGFSTVYAYSQDGRVSTVTRTDNVTEISERYIDGRTKSITGTGVIPRYYSYGINADGTRWTQVNTGSDSSPLWEKTTTDMLGRTIKVEKPGFTNVEVTANYYDLKGRLIKTTSPGQADTLYAYDELSNQVQSGLDVDKNGSLELASHDRITESETLYTPVNESWWQSATQRIYAAETDETETTVSRQRTRLTGLGAGGMTNEAVSIDIHGNQSVTKTFIVREAKTETRVIDYPDSPINSISVSTNGVLNSSQSKTGINITYSYDALGRQTGITDPRTGLTTTHYNNKGQVDYIEDPANNRISYTYDPDTGRKSADTNALNKITRYEYNSRGQIIRTWGDATYPVQYVYDNYGRMSEMHTYRGGTNWNSETWPTGAEGTADVTKWHYQESTGLLTGKEDAAGKSVSYTYGPGESLATRTWARADSGNPVITTYSYDDTTGELTGIVYSDATPNISLAYDRLGRPKTVTDAAGTHTFAFNSNLQLESETISGIYNKMINRTYANSGVIGREIGFTMGTDYNITYGYENTGRFNSVSWSVGAVSKTATYSYVQNSDLINQMTTNTGPKTAYSYEPHRDLRNQVKNEFSGSMISQYDYGYDALGRRNSVANSGLAFSNVTNAFNLYDYNDRNELIESARYLGANISDPSNPIQSEYRSYAYDPIGNRKQSVEGTAAQTYAANMLNQYSQITTNNGQQVTDSLTYDPDGNLTSLASSDGTTNFTYNAENRLIVTEPQSPVDGDKKLEFTYDYIGRRVQKKIYSWQTEQWSLIADYLYLYDGWNLICETISENGQPATNTYYVWGLDLSGSLQGAGGVGGLLASIEPSSGNTYYYFYDVNGNVGQLVNGADGSIAAQYEYDPYGNMIVAVENVANDNPFRFSTKYWDGEAGLYYYGFRYYSPELGRWLNRDPIGERGGYNLYRFVFNNGINIVDLLGLSNERCGKEIGTKIKELLENINNILSKKENQGLRKNICDLVGVILNRGLNAYLEEGWDIKELKQVRYSGYKGTFEDPVNECGIAEPCKDTVSVDRKCYKNDDVNYVLWGMLRKICGRTSLDELIIVYYRTIFSLFTKEEPNLEGRLTWTRVGYDYENRSYLLDGTSHFSINPCFFGENLEDAELAQVTECCECNAPDEYRGTLTARIMMKQKGHFLEIDSDGGKEIIVSFPQENTVQKK